jgi:hypothetical protein
MRLKFYIKNSHSADLSIRKIDPGIFVPDLSVVAKIVFWSGQLQPFI